MRYLFKSFFILPLLVVVIWLTGCEKPLDEAIGPVPAQGSEVFPPVAIQYAALFRMDQLPISAAFFRQQWTWVNFGQAGCTGDCQQRLNKLDKLTDVQALFVITDLADHQRLRELSASFNKVAIAMGTTAVSLDNFTRQFNDEGLSIEQLEQNYFLVGPQAELVYRVTLEELGAASLQQELQAYQAQQGDG